MGTLCWSQFFLMVSNDANTVLSGLAKKASIFLFNNDCVTNCASAEVFNGKAIKVILNLAESALIYCIASADCGSDWLYIIPITSLLPLLGFNTCGMMEKEVSIYFKSSTAPNKFSGGLPLASSTFIRSGVGETISKIGMVLVYCTAVTDDKVVQVASKSTGLDTK